MSGPRLLPASSSQRRVFPDTELVTGSIRSLTEGPPGKTDWSSRSTEHQRIPARLTIVGSVRWWAALLGFAASFQRLPSDLRPRISNRRSYLIVDAITSADTLPGGICFMKPALRMV